MRTIIIPDIHTKHQRAQRILESVTWDDAVFLGDYFDDFGDTPEMNVATAEWLRDNISRGDMIFLVGNHDMSYGFENMRCSGWTRAKQRALGPYIFPLLRNMWAAIRIQDYVFSHAGFNQTTWRKYGIDGANHELDELVENPLAVENWSRANSILWQPGQVSGGFQGDIGGITWLRWDTEFEPIAPLQIVGHTPHREPSWRDGNLDLDTHLHHYAVIEDGTLRVFEVAANILAADRIGKIKDFI